MALSFREGETAQARTHRSCRLCQDTILRQACRIIARRSHLVLIFTAIFLVINVQGSMCRHQQQTTQLRTSYATQATMRKAGKELIVGRIGSGPPLSILVKTIQVGSHHIEGHHAHHTLWTNCPGIRRAVIACSNERIHLIHGLLRTHQQ